MSVKTYQVPMHWAAFEGAHHRGYGNELKRARCLCSRIDSYLPWRSGIAILGEPLQKLPPEADNLRLLVINTYLPKSFLKILIREAGCNLVRMRIRITAKAMKEINDEYATNQ